MFSALYWRRLV